MKKNKAAKKFIAMLQACNEADRKTIHNLSIKKALELKSLEDTLQVAKINEEKAEQIISKNIYLEHPELLTRYEFTSIILKDNNGSVIEIKRLANLFKEFGFNEEEQADVMGYYIKEVISEMLEFRDDVLKKFNIEDSKSSEAKEKINKNITMTFMGITKNKESDVIIPKSITPAEVIEALENLNRYFGEDGTVLPNNIHSDLELLLGQTFILISKEQIFSLKTVMMNRYTQSVEAQAKKTVVTSRPVVELDAEQQKQEKIDRHNAMKIVKTFLDENNMLKEDIIVSEITKLTNALITLDYPDEIIMKIQKTVIAKHDEIQREIKEKQLQDAVNNYLTANNIIIFEDAKTIVDDINYIDSPFYQAVKSNYICVSDLLLQASLIEMYGGEEYLAAPWKNINTDMNLVELLELIELGIMDLNEAIKNYKLSDYHFARTVNKED